MGGGPYGLLPCVGAPGIEGWAGSMVRPGWTKSVLTRRAGVNGPGGETKWAAFSSWIKSFGGDFVQREAREREDCLDSKWQVRNREESYSKCAIISCSRK